MSTMLRLATVSLGALLAVALPARADESLARCRHNAVALTPDGRVLVRTAKHRYLGTLAAVIEDKGARALTLLDVSVDGDDAGWEGDTTVVLFDGQRTGVLVLRDQWESKLPRVIEESDGPRIEDDPADCHIARRTLPPARPPLSCAQRSKRGFTASYRGADLTGEARQLLCETHERMLVERARFGLALARFLCERDRLRTTSASEPWEDTGRRVAALLKECMNVQEIGISTHNQGMALWPEFSLAQCYRHLQVVLDPAKDWPAGTTR